MTTNQLSKPRRGSVWGAALVGIIAAIATLGLGDLFAYVIAPAGRPVTAVGEAIIPHMPDALVEFAKETFGTADKPILIATIIGVVVVIAAIAGILERRRRGVGYTIFGVFIALGIVATSVRQDSGPVTWVPVFLGGLMGVAIFGYLLKKLADADSAFAAASGAGRTGTGLAGVAGVGSDQPPAESPTVKPVVAPSRRGFFAIAGATGAAAVLATVVGNALNQAGAKVAAVRSALKLPGAAKPLAAIPAEAVMDLPGQSPYLIANDKFYRIDTSLNPPQIDPNTWTLKIGGMVDKPFEITYAELLELPLEEHVITMACVSNPVGGDLVGNAKWLGYPIRELLKRAGVQAGANMVLQTSHDGWTCGTPVEALTDDRNALLVVGMNGEPLPVDHGFPVRVVVPGLYGYVSGTKWVTEFKLTTFDKDEGYWTPRGWDALGPIKIQSRIDTPSLTKPPKAGKVVIAGVAWHQGVGIAKVEIQVNNGEWLETELATEFTNEAWLQWRREVDLPAGLTMVKVRATNKKGEVQTEERARPDPNGASGWQTIQFTTQA